MKFIHLIVPTSENDYAPHVLQKTAFLLLCGIIILSFAITNLQSLVWQSSGWLVGTVFPAVVVEETNEARVAQAEAPLRRNALLDEAARLKAEDMAKNGYFDHYSPAGLSPWYWFDRVGYVYAYAGENLAVHFNDSEAVVAAWLASPVHRANIENGKYFEIGVGTAEGEYEGQKTIFVVQLFGTPAAPLQPLQTIPVATHENSSLTSDLAAAKDNHGSINFGSSEFFIATSSLYAPVTAESFALGQTIQSGSSAPAGKLVTAPNTVLRSVYLSIGSLVIIILLLSVAIAIRYHRPQQLAYGIGLLLLMSGLFYLQSALLSTVALAETGSEYGVSEGHL